MQRLVAIHRDVAFHPLRIYYPAVGQHDEQLPLEKRRLRIALPHLRLAALQRRHDGRCVFGRDFDVK
jgi:hypothetical protein